MMEDKEERAARGRSAGGVAEHVLGARHVLLVGSPRICQRLTRAVGVPGAGA